MMNRELEQYLDSNQIPHTWISHDPAYTAQQTAATAHVKGRNFAKTVIVKLNGRMAMTVLPASEKVVWSRLKETAGVHDLELVDEDEFRGRFPGCEAGAMPPFGRLYGMPVFVSKSLAKDDEIAFNGGSHTDCIKLTYNDYEKLEHPRVGDFSY